MRVACGIGKLGYGRDGSKVNFETRWLEGTTTELALLADNAMMRAFDEPHDYEVGVYFKRADALNDLIRTLGSRAS